MAAMSELFERGRWIIALFIVATVLSVLVHLLDSPPSRQAIVADAETGVAAPPRRQSSPPSEPDAEETTGSYGDAPPDAGSGEDTTPEDERQPAAPAQQPARTDDEPVA
jgi:hypothetical protein